MKKARDDSIPYSHTLAREPREAGFWIDSAADTAQSESLAGAQKCDVAIVGGGLTGLSTAYHARQLMPGIDVRVLEGYKCGYGSSGRNAGFSSPLFGMRKSITALRFGKANAIAAHHYMCDAVEYLERLIAAHAIECDYERRGLMLVANSKAQTRRLQKEMRIADRWGLGAVEHWDRARLANEFKTDYYVEGLLNARCGLLNPASLARGLARLVREAGGVVYEESPVIRVAEDQNGYTIGTPDGELRCDRIVFAANAYSDLFPGLAARQLPVLQHVVVSEPLTAAQLESIGWQSRIGFVDARNAIHYYRLTADNRILMGGGDVLPGSTLNLRQASIPRAYARLREHVVRIYPQLKYLKFSHQWGGLGVAIHGPGSRDRICRIGGSCDLFAGFDGTRRFDDALQRALHR